MKIHNIKIRNFKSLYGEHSFDFDRCLGLIKLSGPVGAGKTALGEAILWGLYGAVKKQTNGNLISYNCRTCEVEMDVTSKGKEIHIKRNVIEPLEVTVNGQSLAGSSKRDTQQILEDELYDVPKLAVNKMCVISFNQFSSLVSMNPADTKNFLDNIFGFSLFTRYNDEACQEKKNEQNEQLKLNAVRQDWERQIDSLKEKQKRKSEDIRGSVDTAALDVKRKNLVQEGVELSDAYKKGQKVFQEKRDAVTRQMTEASTLGRQEKNFCETFKTGVCPTCGHPVDAADIEAHRTKMLGYADDYRLHTAERDKMDMDNKPVIQTYTEHINRIKKDIADIDSEVRMYNSRLKTVEENYDQLVREYTDKLTEADIRLKKCDTEIEEWSQMSELFSKSLRYSLLDTLVPHINRSIQSFINRLEQPYRIMFDQEFRCHIYIDTFDREISYNNLSTGQKKILDLAVIFGILQNIIANVDFNILFLDELFSNMDANSRDTMLELLKESTAGTRSCFIINHAEMNDDHFAHKIRVSLHSQLVHGDRRKGTEDVPVMASKYEQLF